MVTSMVQIHEQQNKQTNTFLNWYSNLQMKNLASPSHPSFSKNVQKCLESDEKMKINQRNCSNSTLKSAVWFSVALHIPTCITIIVHRVICSFGSTFKCTSSITFQIISNRLHQRRKQFKFFFSPFFRRFICCEKPNTVNLFMEMVLIVQKRVFISGTVTFVYSPGWSLQRMH